MFRQLRAALLLVAATIVLCSVVYPGFLLLVGQTVFHDKAEGSVLYDSRGRPIGSRLIAQPFSGDEYLHPRPSAASYDGAASAASNWGGNNYLLRDRVARQLGPIVKYASGPKAGQLAGPDVEAWFGKDQFQGSPGIVAQWARAHPALARNWVKADPLNAGFVNAWCEGHTAEVERWKKETSQTPQQKPEDLAVPFFLSFSADHPGRFPIAAERSAGSGKAEKSVEAGGAGVEIQSTFFDMWRQDNSRADLEPIPADLVMASGSGLDPHITLRNARYQLDRVSAKWAAKTGRDAPHVRLEIESLLRENIEAPLAGLAGVELINVLGVNLALDRRYRESHEPETAVP